MCDILWIGFRQKQTAIGTIGVARFRKTIYCSCPSRYVETLRIRKDDATYGFFYFYFLNSMTRRGPLREIFRS